MAQEEGMVFSIDKDGWAQVVTEKKDACGSCGESKCCQFFSSGSKTVTKAMNSVGANAGDWVALNLENQNITKGAAVLYMIPLAGLMIGAMAGAGVSEKWQMNEGASSMLLGFAGLVLGFFITKFISGRMASKGRLTPVITRIIRASAGQPEGLEVDPVCKMALEIQNAPSSFVFNDRTYHFCSPDCRNVFVLDPGRYSNPA